MHVVREQAHALPVMPQHFDQPTATPAEHEQMATEWLCGAPHNHFYVSGEIMWRRRRDDSRGRPCRDSSAT